MSELLQGQMDFIFFIYGLSFLIWLLFVTICREMLSKFFPGSGWDGSD